MPQKIKPAVFLVALLGACAPRVRSDVAPPLPTSVSDVAPDSGFWEGFRDSMVMRAKNGRYYAFASQLRTDSGFINIQVERSADLKVWEQLRDALPLKPEWAEETQEIRSPHVIELDEIALMYYSAKPNPGSINAVRGGTCMNAAHAVGSVEGPYADQGFPLHCVAGTVNMSPMAFDDPVTGKSLLYWSTGSHFTVAALRPSRVQFDPAHDSVDLVLPAAPKTATPPVVEGAWVTYRAPYYYLFYSRRDCCSASAAKSTLVVRSRNAMGPFEGRAGASGSPEAVVVSSRAPASDAGQISIVRDEEGQDWLVHDMPDTRASSPGSTRPTSRARTIVSELLLYEDGWPYVVLP
jgi:arabinan endo-1,5-alpha-L-arabinosidase